MLTMEKIFFTPFLNVEIVVPPLIERIDFHPAEL